MHFVSIYKKSIRPHLYILLCIDNKESGDRRHCAKWKKRELGDKSVLWRRLMRLFNAFLGTFLGSPTTGTVFWFLPMWRRKQETLETSVQCRVCVSTFTHAPCMRMKHTVLLYRSALYIARFQTEVTGDNNRKTPKCHQAEKRCEKKWGKRFSLKAI